MKLSKNTLTAIKNMVQDDVLILSDIAKLNRKILADTEAVKRAIDNWDFDFAKELIEALDTSTRAVKMWEAVLKLGMTHKN